MKHWILMILILPALFLLTAGSISAQSVDIENLNNEQLMQLLLQIMDKLESEGSAETPEPVAPMVLTPTPTIIPTAFSIYELKKLIIEALPEYMFVQPEDHSEPDSPQKTSTSETKTPEPAKGKCPPPCYWYKYDYTNDPACYCP